jgi:putative ABC transport system substrate-binding protein
VLVLKSADRAAYTSVVAGFSAEVNAEVTELTLEEGAEAGARTLERAAALKPAMVLAIGPTAAVGARRALGAVPIVFTMVPYYEKYALEGPRVTGIALTSDFSAELALLKDAFPAGKRVGLLHDPRFSGALFEEVRPRAKELGLALVPLEVESEAAAGRVLYGARGKVDALLMVGDKTVATAAVVKRAILFAHEEKVPFVSLSASQVKEGAMLSLSPSPVGTGQQAGRLANRIIHEKVDPGALAVAPPEGLELAVNLTTARRLAPGCDLAGRILELAARRNHPLKVFE